MRALFVLAFVALACCGDINISPSDISADGTVVIDPTTGTSISPEKAQEIREFGRKLPEHAPQSTQTCSRFVAGRVALFSEGN